MYANDGVVVGITGGNNAYLIHQFKKTNSNITDDIDILAIVRSTYSPEDGTVYLQIWNGTTLSWENLDSDDSSAANVRFGLRKIVRASNANYYDFGNQIAIRVYQLNDSGATKVLSIDQIKISFKSPYSPMYEDQGNQYQSVYPQVATPNYQPLYPSVSTPEYQKVYPSNNPQDDL